jgi:hypothetical protein
MTDKVRATKEQRAIDPITIPVIEPPDIFSSLLGGTWDVVADVEVFAVVNATELVAVGAEKEVDALSLDVTKSRG